MLIMIRYPKTATLIISFVQTWWIIYDFEKNRLNCASLISFDFFTCLHSCIYLTFDNSVTSLLDTTAPRLRCPDLSVTSSEGSPSEMVSWKIDVDDNSISVEPNATVDLHSSPESPQNFTIGRHDIEVTATDRAGNKASCKFWVIVRGALEQSH